LKSTKPLIFDLNSFQEKETPGANPKSFITPISIELAKIHFLETQAKVYILSPLSQLAGQLNKILGLQYNLITLKT